MRRILAAIDSGAPVSAARRPVLRSRPARRLVLCGLAVLVVMVVVVAVLGDAAVVQGGPDSEVQIHAVAGGQLDGAGVMSASCRLVTGAADPGRGLAGVMVRPVPGLVKVQVLPVRVMM